MLTQGQLSEYLAILDEINRLAQGDLVSLWRAAQEMSSEDATQFILDAIPEVAEMYRAGAVEAAIVFYEESQGLAFSELAAAEASRINRQAIQSSAAAMLNGAGNTEHLSLLSGVLQRYVANGARTYAMDGFQITGSGWYRAARPGACNFCRMLATRAVRGWGPYTTADAAFTVGAGKFSRAQKQARGDSFHDNCGCVPVLASAYEAPSYVEAWDADYEAAVDAVGDRFNTNAILSEMRKVSGHTH